TRDAFRLFARGTGNINPLYQDEEYTAKTRWGGLIAHPLFPLTYLRGEAAYGGGFPGVHGTYASGVWYFYRPLRLGDRIVGKESLWDQRLVPSRHAGKMVDQVHYDVTVDAERGEVVTAEYYLIKRWERQAAQERQAAEKPDAKSSERSYAGWKRWVFTKEELQKIRDDYASIEIRGAQPRYWEDVSVGDKVPSLIVGPYTGREIVAFYMGAGAPYVMANAVLFNFFRERSGANVPDAETHTPDVPERTHFETELAKRVGAPDMYDVTHPRIAWGVSMVTNWMGDDAMLRELSSTAWKFNCYGDVLWISGQVTEKYQKGEENLVTIALVWDNQRYRVGWGRAVVSLPARERGPIVLPPLPRDPSGEPFTPLTDEVREVLYSKDPGLPFGSGFSRKE
ncbi:MaoC family dehydratase N-terminal domain-containing protein, partial [Chloroflexota bacterium]